MSTEKTESTIPEPDATTAGTEQAKTGGTPEAEATTEEFDPQTWIRDGVQDSVSWVEDGVERTVSWMKTGLEGMNVSIKTKKSQAETAGEEAYKTAFNEHMRNARREFLLGLKTIVDTALEKVEKDPPVEEPAQTETREV